MKILTDERALQLTELILQNDLVVKEYVDAKTAISAELDNALIAKSDGFYVKDMQGDINTILHDYLTSTDKLDLQMLIQNVNTLVNALDSRVATIESDYLVTTDKYDLQSYIDTKTNLLQLLIDSIANDYLTSADMTNITTAIATAKQDAIDTILGGNVDASLDTLQEIADFIQNNNGGTTGVELVNRLTDVERDVADVVNDITDIKYDIRSIKTNVTDLQNADNVFDSRIADLEAQLGITTGGGNTGGGSTGGSGGTGSTQTIPQQVSNLDTRLSTAENAIVALQNDVANLQFDVATNSDIDSLF